MNILGDLNGWIRDRTRASITGAFGIVGEIDNGIRGVESKGYGLGVKELVEQRSFSFEEIEG